MTSHGRLYLVADGVGGADSGELASRLAVQTILHEYYQQPVTLSVVDRLLAAIDDANAAVYARSEQAAGGRGMATTLVAALIVGGHLLVANVGDSRAYLVRAGGIRQLSRDHSFVARLVADGSITAEEARTHPRRNVITRGIGMEPDVEADTAWEQLVPGDRIVLCTDGLDKHVDDAELAAIASQHRPDEAVRRLIALANERGGSDNITVAVIFVEKGASAATVVRERNSPRLGSAAPPRAASVGRRALAPIGIAAAFFVGCAVGIVLEKTSPLLLPGSGPASAATASATGTATSTVTPSPAATPAAAGPAPATPATATPSATSTATRTATPSASPTPTSTPTATGAPGTSISRIVDGLPPMQLSTPPTKERAGRRDGPT